MRKMLKKKARSCALCKPHKTMGACRWKLRDKDRLLRDVAAIKEVTG